MNSAHGPCACAARSRSNATSCSAWWHSRSIKYSASRSSGPRRPERRPLQPREHRENSPRSMNFARGSDVNSLRIDTQDDEIASWVARDLSGKFINGKWSLSDSLTPCYDHARQATKENDILYCITIDILKYVLNDHAHIHYRTQKHH